MTDCCVIDEIAIKYYEETLHLTVSDRGPISLSIGAGGSITQHIERDNNDPRIWDVGNSKILNVQIIDSTTFRLVTGLNPPETPISAQTYKEMGLPFYRMWRDEGKKDGVAGAWDDMIGVAEIVSKNHQKHKQKDITPWSSESGEWGLLKTGAWGRLQNEEESAEGEGGYKEPSSDFPIVLLDVDDTLPKFRSVAELEESEVWEDMDL